MIPKFISKSDPFILAIIKSLLTLLSDHEIVLPSQKV
jgi:hypothetical protein